MTGSSTPAGTTSWPSRIPNVSISSTVSKPPTAKTGPSAGTLHFRLSYGDTGFHEIYLCLSTAFFRSAPRASKNSLVVLVSQGANASRLPPMLGLGDEVVVGAGFKGYLDVAVETILQEFYPIVALHLMDLHTLAGKFRHENDIWCSSDRWGVYHYEGEES